MKRTTIMISAAASALLLGVGLVAKSHLIAVETALTKQHPFSVQVHRPLLGNRQRRKRNPQPYPITQFIQARSIIEKEPEPKISFFQITNTVCFWIFFLVISYRLLALNQSRQLRKAKSHLFESIDDALINVDSQWLITYVNIQAAAKLGKSPSALVGQSFWTTFPQELGENKKQHYQRARQQQSVVTFETNYIDKTCWLKFRLYPNEDDLLVFWQDISAQKKSDILLTLSMEANDEALQKAYEIQQKAEAERQKAEDANQAKSLFLANMSHELRTPLNAIIGYSEMLEEEAIDFEQVEFVPELRKIQGAGKHLLSLINDVLDLSKIEAGRMEMYLETFEISPLLRDVVATIQPLINKNSNTLRIHCAKGIDKIHADQSKVRQSLLNLLSNASKFTQNGTILLSVTSLNDSDGSWINFQIQDTGIGMKSEQLQKIFNAFAQADSSTTRQYGGTGLGLTITKTFIQMMGGTVTVASDVGKGTTFTIRLPQTVPTMPSIEGTEQRQIEPVKIALKEDVSNADPNLMTEPCSGCVLVIDDDMEACEMIWETLVHQGYFVVLTHNGRKGLKMANQLLPDIIILDDVRQGLSEVNVMQALKENPRLSNIPVILQTALGHNRGNVSGVADYLPKPIKPEQLLAMLAKHQSLR